MKSILLAAAACLLCTGYASAQSFSPLDVLPTEQGTKIVSKTYDAAGNLLGTMSYTVEDVYDNQSIQTMNMDYVMTDSSDYTVDTGTIMASYDGDGFYMKMEKAPVLPDPLDYLSVGTKLMGDFLDHPDIFGEEYPVFDNFEEGNIFHLDGGNMDVRAIGDRSNDMNLQVNNRRYLGTEKIHTPAGEFHTYKIAFDVDMYDRETQSKETYKGVEWFSDGTGIVRTEIYDKDNNLLNYTVVTSVTR